MEENKGAKIYMFVRDNLKENPDLLEWFIKGIAHGMAISVDQARRDQADWEIIANMAMNKRLMDGNELFLADKIDALKPRSCLKWDWYADKLRGIIAKKQEKE